MFSGISMRALIGRRRMRSSGRRPAAGPGVLSLARVAPRWVAAAAAASLGSEMGPGGDLVTCRDLTRPLGSGVTPDTVSGETLAALLLDMTVLLDAVASHFLDRRDSPCLPLPSPNIESWLSLILTDTVERMDAM